MSEIANQTKKNRWLILFAGICSHIPVVINMTTLHVAVPSLTKALNATGNEVLWIIDIYALVMAGLLVPMGTLADKIGAKKVLLYGLVLFFIASLFAAMAPTAGFLILGRTLLAFAAAFIMPSILSIVRNTFDDEKERGIALGLWGTVTAAGGAVGPLIGGALLEHFWWGSVFLMNIPLLLLIIPFVYYVVPTFKANEKLTWEIKQAIILVVGLLATIYSIKTIFKPESSKFVVAIVFIFGMSLLGWFVRKQLRSPRPMLDLNLFRLPAITMGLLIALLVSGAFAGSELTIAQELQFVLQKSPLESGLFMTPLMLASAIGGPFAGYLVSYFGLRKVSTLSLLIAAGCFAGLGFSDFHNDGLLVAFYMAMMGLSLSIGLTSSSIAIMSSAPPEKAGAAGSIEGVGYELGMGLGITGFGLLLSMSYRNMLKIPSEMVDKISPQAFYSISDTYVAAKNLSLVEREELIKAGQVAFATSHGVVLLTAAAMVTLVAFAVFFILGTGKTK